MGVLITKNFLSTKEVEATSRWLKLKEQYWLDDAFSVTFLKEDIPSHFQKFINDKFNLYHFIFLITKNSKEIECHVDGDYRDLIVSELPGSIISYPETLVYYYELDNQMEGGRLKINNHEIIPEMNMAVTIPPNTQHSVTEVSKAKTPRFSIVCERYYALNRVITKIKSPMYRKG
jgi:hypothetical protein